MKKTTSKKLSLPKLTLRTLMSRDLTNVQGGAVSGPTMGETCAVTAMTIHGDSAVAVESSASASHDCVKLQHRACRVPTRRTGERLEANLAAGEPCSGKSCPFDDVALARVAMSRTDP